MAGNLTAMIAAAFSGSAAPPVTSDPYFEYTTLLLPGNGTNGAQNNTFLDSSTNNFTITRNGNTTQGTFSPFSQTGWGNYFNGSSGNLTVPYNSDFDYGSGDFTIEFWMYPTATGDRGILIQSNNYSTYGPIWIRYTSGTINIFATTANSAWNLFNNTVITGTIPLNTWTHIAITRTSAGVWTSYVNGTSAWTATAAGSLYVNSNSTNIGTVTSDTSLVFSGYLSNLRIVKGIVVYTGNFTPPTSALTSTQSSGTNIAAITGTETSLLTCQSNRFIDNSSNTFTVTPNGSPTVVAFSPFNPTASWSAATYGGSGYFDGNGDYLQIAANAAFQFDADFTVECWFYSGTGTTASKYDQIVGTIESATTGYWRLGSEFNGGKQLWFTWTTGTYNDITTSFSVSDNAWHHLAVTRISNSVRLFVDGVQKGSTTTVTTNLNASAPLMVMNSTQGTNQAQGYVGSLRIIKGQGLYNGTFTPPTTPFTTTSVGSTGAGAASSITGTVGVLLNYTNAGIYDATSKNDLETVGDARISTAITAKWGTGSMYFDGTGDYLSSPATPQWIMSGDWTIESWIYPNSISGVQVLVDTRNRTLNSSPAMYLNGTNLVIDTGTGVVVSAGTITISTWQHVAATRSGNSWRIFINGTQVGSTTTNTTSYTTAYGCAIGTSYFNENYNGYLQDLRITKGYARYVTGTGANAGQMVFNGTNTLALPTAAFPTQ